MAPKPPQERYRGQRTGLCRIRTILCRSLRSPRQRLERETDGRTQSICACARGDREAHCNVIGVHIEKTGSHAADNQYLPAHAMNMQTKIWGGQQRFERSDTRSVTGDRDLREPRSGNRRGGQWFSFPGGRTSSEKLGCPWRTEPHK